MIAVSRSFCHPDYFVRSNYLAMAEGSVDILTITFNPCIDIHFSVDRLEPEMKLRCSSPEYQPGGGGINIARAIHRLGGHALAVFPAGGNSGKMLEDLLAREGVHALSVNTPSITRETLNVTESSTGKQFRFLFPGAAMPKNVWQDCIQAINLVKEGGFLVVSGSLPDDPPGQLFNMIHTAAADRKARLVIDTSGSALQEALKAGAWLVKPSLAEFESLAGFRNLKEASIIEKSRELIRRGYASVVLVSAGVAGVYLVTADSSCQIPSPEIDKRSTIGAGDCLVAGTLFRLTQSPDLMEAVRYGVACAAASVMRPGTAMFNKEDADLLYAKMATLPDQMPQF